MHAICNPDGSAWLDENCVAGTAEELKPVLSDLRRDTGDGFCIVPLYTATPAPAVPNEKAITPCFDTLALDTAKMVMCDVNRRSDFLGGDTQLLSRIQCRIDNACRAAMLAAAPECN
jgi:hypothetical protein